MVIKVRATLEHLQMLRRYVRLLEPYRARSIRELTPDRITYGGALPHLQLSVQNVLNVSAHLNAEFDLDRASDYRETVLNLEERGILPTTSRTVSRAYQAFEIS